MQPHHPSRLLRISLLSNALFSTLSGLCLVIASGPIASLIGLDLPVVLTVVGTSLLLFAVGLTTNGLRSRVRQSEVKLAIALDSAWVVASVGIILAGVLSTTGDWTVAIVADVVLLLAYLQFMGLRKLRQPVNVTS